jgi:hypothetical protein
MATLFHGPKPEEPVVSYTVEFNANGASGSAPLAQTVHAGGIINLPAQGGMTNAGNAFNGWSESGANYAVGTQIAVIRNMVFYAQWIDPSTPKFTVTFNGNGASGSPPAQQTVFSGSQMITPTQGSLTFSGRRFGGWNTLATGLGSSYAAGVSIEVSSNLTLYAMWFDSSEQQFTIAFYANGASGTPPSSKTASYGVSIILPDAGNLTFSGRTFAGWNTNSDGTGGNYAANSSYVVLGNAMLYAKWSTGSADDSIVKSIKLVNFPNNASMTILLSTSKTNYSSFRTNLVAGAQETIAYGNDTFHVVKVANSSGLTTTNWTGSGSYYVYIDGSGSSMHYWFISNNTISFNSAETVIDCTNIWTEWTNVAVNWAD